MGGDTRDPAALEESLWQTLDQAKSRGLDGAVLERKKRKFLGRYLRNFNDPESTAYSFLSALGQKSDLFDFPAVLEKVTLADVHERVRSLFERRRSAASLLLPMG